jgi:hypothetical protein
MVVRTAKHFYAPPMTVWIRCQLQEGNAVGTYGKYVPTWAFTSAMKVRYRYFCRNLQNIIPHSETLSEHHTRRQA